MKVKDHRITINAVLLQLFTFFGYADSSSLLSLTFGAIFFNGLLQLAWPMHLHN